MRTTEVVVPVSIREAPREGGLVRLVVEEADTGPRTVLLQPGQRLTLGRGVTSAVVLSDAFVSRHHATIAFDGTTPTLEDTGSTNGTFLSDQRVCGVQRLGTGDVIVIGTARISVVQVDSTTCTDDGASGRALATVLGAVAQDPATVGVFRLAARLARSNLPVLVVGETGTGKEVVARAIHHASARSRGPFIPINCATLTESLAESLLFGHERGSFTGATARQAGFIEQANGGTLFLDEVGELSLTNQARLLRVLHDGVVVRVGSNQPIRLDVRVISATNRDLSVEIGWRRLREDLFFRLDGATILVPPLRARPADLMAITAQLLALGDAGMRISPAAMTVLRTYHWPGNVRELRNAIEHALTVSSGRVIEPRDLPPAVRGGTATGPATVTLPLAERVAKLERHTIAAALAATGGNQTQAARVLGITRRSLIYRMEIHGLKRRPGQSSDRGWNASARTASTEGAAAQPRGFPQGLTT